MAKKKGVARHDWEDFKARYMASDIVTIAEFFRKELGLKYAGFISEKTRGWRKEKIAMWEQANEEAKEIIKRKLVKDNVKLAAGLHNLELWVASLFSSKEKLDELGIDDAQKIKTFSDMLNNRLGLPTSISKSTINGEIKTNPFEEIKNIIDKK